MNTRPGNKNKPEDLIDIKLFQDLQDRLNEIYSFPSAIIDNDSNILTTSGLQEISTNFHRKNKECIQQPTQKPSTASSQVNMKQIASTAITAVGISNHQNVMQHTPSNAPSVQANRLGLVGFHVGLICDVITVPMMPAGLSGVSPKVAATDISNITNAPT